MKHLIFLFLPLSVYATDIPKPPATAQDITQTQSQQNQASSKSDADSAVSLTIKDRLQVPNTPAPTAPAIYASNPCALGESSAVTLPVFGKANGKTTVDAGCEFRELVRVTASVDPCLARKLLATHPAIAALNPEPAECVSTNELAELERRLTDKIGTAFKQSQSK